MVTCREHSSSMKHKFFFILGIILIPYLLLFVHLRLLMTNESFYDQQYQINGAYERFGKEKVLNETDNILNYYLHNKPLTTSFLNDKEKSHLADVKFLYITSKILFVVFFMTMLFCMILTPLEHRLSLVWYGSLVTLSGLVVLSLLVWTSFTPLFMWFHQVVFDNTNWMLDPATDNLILVTSESFFSAFILRIIRNTLLSALLLLIISGFFSRKLKGLQTFRMKH